MGDLPNGWKAVLRSERVDMLYGSKAVVDVNIWIAVYGSIQNDAAHWVYTCCFTVFKSRDNSIANAV
jgi:hypothetical protein